MNTRNGNTALTPAQLLRQLSQNTQRLVLVSPTPALLPGLEHWVGKLDRFVLTDSRDGFGSEFIADTGLTTQDFVSSAEAAAFLSEAAAAAVGSGMVVPMPDLGAKSEGDLARILEGAKVPSLLRSVGKPDDYADFRKRCRNAGLSFSVDVLPASAAAGGVALSVTSEEDWAAVQSTISGQDLICLPQASGPGFSMEAFASPNGVIPTFVQRQAHDQYWGISRWVGASNSPAVDDSVTRAVNQLVQKVGLALAENSFIGVFGVQCELLDGKMRLRRIVTSLSPDSLATHCITSLHCGMPFHLLQIHRSTGLDHGLDIECFKGKFSAADADCWTVLAIRHIGSVAEMITRAPTSGLYMLRDGEEPACVSQSTDWQAALGGDHAYFLRLQSAGNYRTPGGLLGLLYVRDECLDDGHRLNRLGQKWVDAIYAGYTGLAVSGSSLPKGILAQPANDVL